MTARMSCSMTVDSVRDRSKTVTRRHVDTWKNLHAGDRLILIEKGMGLAKGEKQVVLAEVEVVSVRIETLGDLDQGECDREGFTHMTPVEFARFWADGHGYGKRVHVDVLRNVECRRIEWVYLPEFVVTEHPVDRSVGR